MAILVGVTAEGRYTAASIQNTGEPFPDDYDAQGWCDRHCATLGLAVGALAPRFFDDDADPRKDDLLHEPEPQTRPEPVPVARPTFTDAEVLQLKAIAAKASGI